MEKNPLSLCPICWRSAHDVGIFPISTMSLVLSVAFNYFSKLKFENDFIAEVVNKKLKFNFIELKLIIYMN